MIEYPGTAIENLYFLEAGAASMTTTFDNGSQVEVGLFGYESVLGVSAHGACAVAFVVVVWALLGC